MPCDSQPCLHAHRWYLTPQSCQPQVSSSSRRLLCVRVSVQKLLDFYQGRQKAVSHCIVLVLAGSTGQTVSSVDALFQHLCVTVLQQSHLCPVPVDTRPVYWQYDHALHLYPAPDLIVLADSAAPAQFSFKDTEFVNPVRCIMPWMPSCLHYTQ